MWKIVCWMRYLYVVLYHKFYVFVAGRYINSKLRPSGFSVSLSRMLLHDLSKFSPSEFFPYAYYYYGENPRDPNDNDFKKAWIHHYQNNDHHPEFFKSGNQINRMSGDAMMELIADWFAANQAYEGNWPQPGKWHWLKKNFSTQPIHEVDKCFIGLILSILGFEEDLIDSFGIDNSSRIINEKGSALDDVQFKKLLRLYSTTKQQ
eukprot:TRINITY_DN2185_c0_g1_i3.p2 TRINITY_DN2185_c0_g1~~TRINITY_DN2185_c0_g1_i3.p2  ORF type:complete len:205 (-),score=34.16 TRINITY_DN2185_c0_g1_i3:761-1375(-)